MFQGGVSCPICGFETLNIGTKTGKFNKIDFYLWRCPSCRYAFVSNPWTEYDKIYSEAYYKGEGPDPCIDYIFEMDHPHISIREYEYRGILGIVSSLKRVNRHTRWLDYGCGHGGLVRYCREHAGCEIFGFDRGWIRARASSHGIPCLEWDDLREAGTEGGFDVITAIEVLEHVDNPDQFLQIIHSLLKPGGLFFYTTGNAEPFRNRLLTWRYVIPEIHIGFFEPATLVHALRQAGFRPESPGFLPGHVDIIRFKILKNHGVRTKSRWERTVPWAILARVVDKMYGISALPIAWG